MAVSIEKSFFENKKVFVDDSFADIIPWFLENRKEDLKKVKELLVASDYQQIQRMGHRWKGTCASYGFEKLSLAGEAMEELSIQKSKNEILELVANSEEYMDQLEIVYVRSSDEQTSQAPTNSKRDLQP